MAAIPRAPFATSRMKRRVDTIVFFSPGQFLIRTRGRSTVEAGRAAAQPPCPDGGIDPPTRNRIVNASVFSRDDDLLRRLLFLLFATVLGQFSSSACAQPYNPYADSQESFAPVAPDGTLRWGTFYKSAALQKSYERLWNLGACKGTNKAITIPVARNKLVIDNLPEESFTGRVRGANGSLAGGLIAFSEGNAPDPAAPVLVAQLHPAGVSRLEINGRAAVQSIKPGMTVRLRTTVDEKGRASEPVRSIELVSTPADFTPDAVRPDVRETVVGTVTLFRNGLLMLKVDAGRIRRLAIPVVDQPDVTITSASQLELVDPGDEILITGRRWSGEGAMAAGTVFASSLSVNKATVEPAATATNPRPEKTR